jgi:quaternary ammonium compound-resistance protein SugE
MIPKACFLGFLGSAPAAGMVREKTRGNTRAHGRTKAWEISIVDMSGFLFVLWGFERSESSMAWIYLAAAGLFEVVWAISLKYTNGFTRLTPSLLTLAGMIISFYLLALATKTLPIGTAYAVWTGIGAVGAVLVGMLFLNEPINAARLFFLALILAGIIGLKLTSGH